MNVASLLRSAADLRPAKVALRFGAGGDATVTYADMDAEADRVARWLVANRIGRGDRVAIAMPNGPHFAYAYFGILRAGAIAVPLNAMLTAPEVARIVDDCGASAMLVGGPFGEVAASTADLRPVGRSSAWTELGGLQGEPVHVNVSEDDLAVLAYTSGTTGDPKGAMLTHANLLANLDQQMAIPDARVRTDDDVLVALPLSHIYGLNVCLGLLVKNAATGIVVERFEAKSALELIDRHRVTVVFGAPPMYVAWTSLPESGSHDMRTVRLAISGAAPLAPEVLERFRERFGVDIYEGYGLTETAPTVTSNRMADAPRPGSVGKPLPGVELRIVDDGGDDVEPGDPGEVIVRGPNVFRGYWNRPQDTEAALRDGWFHTGDIAVQDDDGYIYLVDRKRDLIIVSGFNVFPAEVEDALTSHPVVKEAAVVGVPDPYTGEAVAAYVVVEPGTEATEPELLAFVGTRLARFKTPKRVTFVEELPHVLTGKVLRRALRTGSV